MPLLLNSHKILRCTPFFCSEIIIVTQSRYRRSEGRHVYCHNVTLEDAAPFHGSIHINKMKFKNKHIARISLSLCGLLSFGVCDAAKAESAPYDVSWEMTPVG